MKKIILQGTLIILMFFSTWFLLRQVDWMNLLNVEKTADKTEHKLGELLLEIYKQNDSVNTDKFVLQSIDSVVTKICIANNIDRDNIQFHVVDENKVNAFALPDGHLILFSGLILEAENPAELSGVISHEIAHIELNHVMQKLVKEVGLAVLVSMTTGGNETVIVKEILKTLSSSAFDRSLEKEADIKAVEYLINAKIDPEPFANFLYKIANNDGDLNQYFSWINTHPDSKERAEYIVKHNTDKVLETEPVLSQQTWDLLKENLRN